jgi:hypothetical protein
MVHIANYIGFPFVKDYDMPTAIQIRAGAHSFEGKVFTIVSCSAMSQEIVDTLALDEPMRAMLSGTPAAFSGIYGPDGRLITEPLIDDEGIVYAELDLDRCIEPKQYHDIIGHYNRFDIFELNVNRTPQSAVRLHGDTAEVESGDAPNTRNDNLNFGPQGDTPERKVHGVDRR